MLSALSALLPVLAGQAALLTVRAAPEQGCPSAGQVADALGVRLPGAVLDEPEAGGGEVFTVEVTGEPGRPVLSLYDATGAARLRRTLLPDSAVEKDCAALADTVAIIVERFLDELGVITRPPSAPAPASAGPAVTPVTADRPGLPPHPRGELALLTEARSGRDGLASFGLLAAARRYRRGDGPAFPRAAFFLDLRLGVQGPQSLDWLGPEGDARTGTVYGARAQLAAGCAWVAAPVRAEGLLGLGTDLLLVHEDPGPGGQAAARDRLALGPDLAAELAVTVPLSRAVFVRLAGGGHLAVVRHVLRAPVVAGMSPVVAETPRAFATASLALGMALW